MATTANAYPTITIDLILDRPTTKDVLRGVLHSILFHRLFGTVKPQTFEVLDVTMPGVADAEMEQLVNEKVDAFWKGIESGSNKRGRITVTFSEKRPKKSWFQVYMGEEEVPWEQWVINAELRQPNSDRDRQAFNTDLATTLTNTVHMMLSHTSSERGRTAVPPITIASGISPFPISMTVSFGGVELYLTITSEMLAVGSLSNRDLHVVFLSFFASSVIQGIVAYILRELFVVWHLQLLL